MGAVATTWKHPVSTAGSMAKQAVRTRLQSIDALRGFVMVVMLLDHVRETWFLHMQVPDPMNALAVAPSLFFTRLTSTICAPVFIALTGLGAYLYSRNHSRAETSAYLIKRGLFLMALDVMLFSMIWATRMPPTIWLQVIWCIGICMIALAALQRLPRPVLLALGLVIVCGHNLLDGIVLAPGDTFFVPWAMLHQRDAFEFAGLTFKTTYPVLAWIGVILLGYGIGPWFERDVDPALRQRRLLSLGFGMLAAFVAIRFLNVYGDKPWFTVEGDPLRTVMSFIALTKYPPSLLFLLPTLGLGAILLALFERAQQARWIDVLSVFGAAPMFFYILHLCVLRILYHIAYQIWGPTQGTVFGVNSIGWVWAWYVAMLVPLYLPTAWYSRLKARRRDIAWLKYL
jgi:uncharacterized membrane protein